MNRMIVAALAALSLPLVVIAPRALAAATASSTAKPAKPLHVARGAKVSLADLCIPGKTMIFDFYSDFCPPCVQVAPMLEKLHQQREDIVVVKVDINRPETKGRIDWQSPVARQYGLQSIPHFKVFGPDGKLKVEDRPPQAAARQLVLSWIK